MYVLLRLLASQTLLQRSQRSIATSLSGLAILCSLTMLGPHKTEKKEGLAIANAICLLINHAKWLKTMVYLLKVKESL